MKKKIKAYLLYLIDEHKQNKEYSIFYNNKFNFVLYFLIILIGPLVYYFFKSYIVAWTFGFLCSICLDNIFNKRRK